MWTIFKVFIEFVTILLLFYIVCFFHCEACGITDQGSNDTLYIGRLSLQPDCQGSPHINRDLLSYILQCACPGN